MCGICGQLRFDRRKVSSETLNKMMLKLARRGPDSNGQWINGKIGFGHQRLSVIDLSSLGSQPMIDDKLKLSLVFNGTIYNYKSLRDQLTSKGYTFFSQSDTEVILKAYHFWGENCVKYLDGMFAFAIWDSSSLINYLLQGIEWVLSHSTITQLPKPLLLHPIHRLY